MKRMRAIIEVHRWPLRVVTGGPATFLRELRVKRITPKREIE